MGKDKKDKSKGKEKTAKSSKKKKKDKDKSKKHKDDKTKQSASAEKVSSSTGSKGGAARLIVMRHSERLDRVFPGWQQDTMQSGVYQPYDLNQPLQLVARPSIQDYYNDSPITEIGAVSAQMVARAMRLVSSRPTVIYCSPALRCVQTATHIWKTLAVGDKKDMKKIRVEPALFEWFKWYPKPPKWLSVEEMAAAGFPVDDKYTQMCPVSKLTQVCANETVEAYMQRTSSVLTGLSRANQGEIVLIVAHAPTLDATRAFVGKDVKKTTEKDMTSMGQNYPYVASIVLDSTKASDGKLTWKRNDDLLPIMSMLDSTSRPNYEVYDRP